MKRLRISFLDGYCLLTTMESLAALDNALIEAKKNNEYLFVNSNDGTDILINPDHVIMAREHFDEISY